MINNTQDTGSTVALLASLNASSGFAMNASVAAGTQARFLKLLVTQMRHQEPLNPMDNAQAASQMAQLCTVTGIDKLKALNDSILSNQLLQAAALIINHGMLAPGNGIDLSNGSGYGGIELAQSTDRVDIAIYDKSDALVRNIQLGTQPVGLVNWQWDGRNNSGVSVADGSYTFTVAAVQAGKKVDAAALQFGLVR